MAAMDADAARLHIERLRVHRVRAPRETALGPSIEALTARLRREASRIGGVSEAWEAVCPPELADRTAVEGVHRGVLVVRAADAATRYALDRALRGGGERELVRRSPAAIRRVQVRIAPVAPRGGDPGTGDLRAGRERASERP